MGLFGRKQTEKNGRLHGRLQDESVIPFEKAVLCMDCGSVFYYNRTLSCPKCTGNAVLMLSGFFGLDLSSAKKKEVKEENVVCGPVTVKVASLNADQNPKKNPDSGVIPFYRIKLRK